MCASVDTEPKMHLLPIFFFCRCSLLSPPREGLGGREERLVSYNG